MLYAVLVVALVVLDQVVKFLVRANIPWGRRPLSPPYSPSHLCAEHRRGLLPAGGAHLDSDHCVPGGVRPAGGASGEKVFPRPFAMAALSMVLAGAVGNLIDRALLGYVTDMFETLFMRFAVFNVADICVVVGGIAFCVYYLFFHGKGGGPWSRFCCGLTGRGSGPTSSWPGWCRS